ncbi:hypothetical protein LINPERPRIM_LOCUS25007, partial [Linum perenne]
LHARPFLTKSDDGASKTNTSAADRRPSDFESLNDESQRKRTEAHRRGDRRRGHVADGHGISGTTKQVTSPRW